MRWSRENEGAISHCCTETSILLRTRQPYPIDEAPDNSRKIPIGKNEIVENERKRIKKRTETNMTPGLNPPSSTLDPRPECLDGNP